MAFFLNYKSCFPTALALMGHLRFRKQGFFAVVFIYRIQRTAELAPELNTEMNSA
jgi:hypothetical protein